LEAEAHGKLENWALEHSGYARLNNSAELVAQARCEPWLLALRRQMLREDRQADNFLIQKRICLVRCEVPHPLSEQVRNVMDMLQSLRSLNGLAFAFVHLADQ